MKNIKYRLTVVLILICTVNYTQTTINGFGAAGHDVPFTGNTNTHFLGWIDNDIPLQFRTNNNVGMELAKSENITVNGLTFNHAGFLGISPDLNFYNKGAFSLLHLSGGNDGFSGFAQELGFRKWMKYGTTITANQDLMYVGIKDNLGLDVSEAVIAWSDNISGSLTDNLVFKFTSGQPDPNATVPNRTEDGLEVARFAPDGNVGIGNFSSSTWGTGATAGAGLDEQPTQRLDVEGTIRLRMMPDSMPAVLITGVVADSLNGDTLGDYILNYIPLDSVNFGSDCDWAWNPSELTLATATELNANYLDGECAPATGKVVIGTNFVKDAKLLVYEDNFGVVEPDIFIGIQSTLNKHNPNQSSQAHFGMYSEALSRFSRNNIGGFYEGRNGNNYNYGIVGKAFSDQFNGWGLNALNVGVYGEAVGSNNLNYSGYFVGTMVHTGSALTVSDEMLKDNIEDMEGAIEIIKELQPRYYNYRCDEFPNMQLEEGLQCGLIAQELVEVIPTLVHDAIFPERYDSIGMITDEEFSFKAVNYKDLIPFIIQATKEQQVIIEAQEEALGVMQEQILVQTDAQEETIANLQSTVSEMQGQLEELTGLLMLCCDAKSMGNDHSNGQNQTSGTYELYQNNPNPFDNYTNISWKMAEDNVAKIIVQDMSGREITTLVNEQSSKGLDNVRWENSDLPAGTYFYSLIVNEELMVKRAVKIQ